jgi:hypothetical protein
MRKLRKCGICGSYGNVSVWNAEVTEMWNWRKLRKCESVECGTCGNVEISVEMWNYYVLKCLLKCGMRKCGMRNAEVWNAVPQFPHSAFHISTFPTNET